MVKIKVLGASLASIILVPQSCTAFKCAPWVPEKECLASASAFSARLRNSTIAGPHIPPPTPPPVPATTTLLTQNIGVGVPSPCTLSDPSGTGTIILESCARKTAYSKPWPPPSRAALGTTQSVWLIDASSTGEFILATAVPNTRFLAAAIPTGAWSTCVQGGIMTCLGPSCNSDPYARKCVDKHRPIATVRELCIDGVPSKCEMFYCVEDENVPLDVCGATAIPRSKTVERAKAKETCVGPGGAGKGPRIKQNGECGSWRPKDR